MGVHLGSTKIKRESTNFQAVKDRMECLYVSHMEGEEQQNFCVEGGESRTDFRAY